MPRRVTWGTPSRASHYLRPRRAYPLLLAGLAAGALAAAALLASHATGGRGALSPGPVISAHAPLEARCEECHAAGRGATDARCQRCHDPAGATRLSHSAHVFFGSRDADAAFRAPAIPCARCHVDHRGRSAALTRVGESRCRECHFRSLAGHPEFLPLREPSIEVPGLQFPHERHVRELVEKQGLTLATSCTRCHEPHNQDFEPIAFERHCAACHARGGSVGAMDPVAEPDVLSLEAIRARGFESDWLDRADGFESRRGRIARASLRHADPWVLYNLGRQRQRLFPELVAVERGALQARLGQLRRRQVFSTPLAGLGSEDLEAREAAVTRELRGAEARLTALAKGGGPASGSARFDAVLDAVRAVDPASVERVGALWEQARSLGSASPPAESLPDAEWRARRDELLGALDVLRSVDPALEGRSEDLRRRLLSLRPGDDAAEAMTRVRDQRAAELDRVRDERELRAGGTAAPRAVLLVRQAGAEQRALEHVERLLRELDRMAGELPIDDEAEREQALGSVDVLTAACAKCHVVEDAALAPVAAAQRVLVRSTFQHGPHLLQADCARCHPSVADSQSSADLNLRGIDGCRECHGAVGVFDDCQSCHDYHPPVTP